MICLFGCGVGQQRATHMSSKNHNRIEFLGLPGSGKSTLYRAIVDGNNEKKYEKSSVGLLDLIYWIRVIVSESIKSGTIKLIRFKLALLFNMKKKDNISQGNNLIVEEGWLQRILSCYEGDISDKNLERAFQHIQRPDLVVLLDNSSPELFKRYNDQNNPRTKMGEDYINSWKGSVRFNLEKIVSYLENSGIKYKTVSIHSDIRNIL